jgi:hypothetical protein
MYTHTHTQHNMMYMGVGLCGWMRVWVGVAALASARYPGMEVKTCHNYDIAYKYRWQCQVECVLYRFNVSVYIECVLYR